MCTTTINVHRRTLNIEFIILFCFIKFERYNSFKTALSLWPLIPYFCMCKTKISCIYYWLSRLRCTFYEEIIYTWYVCRLENVWYITCMLFIQTMPNIPLFKRCGAYLLVETWFLQLAKIDALPVFKAGKRENVAKRKV